MVVAEHGCIDWDDLIHLSDDCDAYLNAVDGLSMALFGKPAVDLVEELDAAVHSLQDSFSSNGELPALNP